MVILNQGKRNEVTIRLVLESDVHGREYFDRYDNIREVVDALELLVKRAAEEAALDRVEWAVSIAIVPKAAYGNDAGYGFGLGQVAD